MKVLVLYCGGGGACMGLHQAWPDAEIVGVDIEPQPRYPFSFVRADVMQMEVSRDGLFTIREHPDRGPILWEYKPDFVWASPPCQHYSQCTPKKFRGNHADLIEPTRNMLRKANVPFVIENVPSAAKLLIHPLMLCGSMFGLGIRRHRFFEISGFSVAQLLPRCDHSKAPVLITGTHRRTYEPRYKYSAQDCRDASGLHWMRRIDMDKAIPPAFSEFIAKQFTGATHENP